MPLPVEDQSQLSVGGFAGIKKVQGLLVDINVEDPPASWENADKQIVRVSLEDATVLEMFGDEDPITFKDGKWNFTITYAKAGQTPTEGSVYNKCWLQSAKELGKVPSAFIGEMVVLEKQGRKLFDTVEMEDYTTSSGETKKRPVLDADGNKIVKPIYATADQTEDGRPSKSAFCFVGESSADSDDVKDHIKTIVTGLNSSAALRKLMTDTKAKQFPEYREKHKNGALAEFLGIEVVDDIYVDPEGADEDSSS